VKKRPVRIALALTAVAAIVPLSGCAALLSSQQTAQYEYSGGDGAWTELDGVKVRGLVFAQNEQGEAQVFYTLVNSTNEPRTVSISAGAGSPLTHSLEPNEVFEQYPAGVEARSGAAASEPVIVEGLDAVPGEQVDVDVTVGSESETLRVQVLNDEIPYYDGLVPTTSPSGDPTEGAEDASGAQGAGAEGAEG
jgi:hypothetical protein